MDSHELMYPRRRNVLEKEMVIYRIPRFERVRSIGSNENGFGNFREKFGGKLYPSFFVHIKRLK